VLGLLSAAAAQAKSFRTETYDSNIRILANGDLQVTESVAFRFIGGPFTSTWRTLPLRGVDGIQVESASDSIVVREANRHVEIRWHFPAMHDTVHVFTLRYRVQGAIWQVGDERRLDWRAFPHERRYRIEHATADLEWPREWGEPRRVGAAPKSTRIERREGGAHFDAGSLRKEVTLRLGVEFPRTAVAAPVPQWQQRDEARRESLPVVAGIAIAILLFGVGIVIALHRDTRGQSTTSASSTRHSTPPSELPAAIAGALRRGDAGVNEAVACFVELAVRGHVQFDTVREKRRWSLGSFTVRRTQPPRTLEPWERIVLDAAFRGQASEASVARAWTGIRGAVRPFRVAVREELRRRGEWNSAAEHDRQRLWMCAVFFGVATVAMLACVPLLWARTGPWSFLIVGALAVITLVACIGASTVTRLSPLGQQRAAAWNGFRSHLVGLGKGSGSDKQLQGLDAQRFAQWFPYAVAFGIATLWLQAGARARLAVPTFFRVPPGADGMSSFASAFGISGASGESWVASAGAGSSAGGAGGGGSGAH